MFGIIVWVILIFVLVIMMEGAMGIIMLFVIAPLIVFFLISIMYGIVYLNDQLKKKEEEEELKRIRAEHWEKLQERIKQQEERQKQNKR